MSASSNVADTPVTVAVTGAAGQIGYALLFRLAAGAVLGPEQPIRLHLLEVPQARAALDGVIMELEDAAFPTLQGVVATDDPMVAFRDAEQVFLVGARPRGPGMQRGDLLQANADIFRTQGQALDAVASRSVRVVVVGNPANTNALIAQRHAPSLDVRCFSAMTRLDHNRALARLAAKLHCGVGDIHRLCVWGNHSSTQYPDVSYATVAGQPLAAQLDPTWLEQQFLPAVTERGAAIIKARGASSAASAASAAIDHMRDWALGSADWVSMALPADGAYDIPEGLVYSFPVQCSDGQANIVRDLDISAASRQRMDRSRDELQQELDAIRSLLP